jgi:hypothetical protein
MTSLIPSSHQTSWSSCFADAQAARQAVDMALPSIESAMTSTEVCGSGFLYIVVMDPGIGPADARFEEAILVEHGIGDRDKWDADYAAFAYAKAKVSWTSGCDTSRVQATRAHLLKAGDSLLWGSVWLDGIVVAVSGAHPWYDEAFAVSVAANLRAIAKARHASALQAGKWSASAESAPLNSSTHNAFVRPVVNALTGVQANGK